jgi:hypothetical protein
MDHVIVSMYVSSLGQWCYARTDAKLCSLRKIILFFFLCIILYELLCGIVSSPDGVLKYLETFVVEEL